MSFDHVQEFKNVYMSTKIPGNCLVGKGPGKLTCRFRDINKKK